MLSSKTNSPREIKAEEPKTQQKKNEKNEKRTEQKSPSSHRKQKRKRHAKIRRQNRLLSLCAGTESLKFVWQVAW